MPLFQNSLDWRATQIYAAYYRSCAFAGAETIQSNNLSGVGVTTVGASGNDPNGGISGGGNFGHVTVVVPTGPVTVQFPHNLSYAPTVVFAIPEQAEGGTPASIYGVVWSKVTGASGTIAINFSSTGTWDVYFA